MAQSTKKVSISFSKKVWKKVQRANHVRKKSMQSSNMPASKSLKLIFANVYFFATFSANVFSQSYFFATFFANVFSHSYFLSTFSTLCCPKVPKKCHKSTFACQLLNVLFPVCPLFFPRTIYRVLVVFLLTLFLFETLFCC